MFRRALFVLVAAVTLVTAPGALAFAQCGVKGTGSIHVGNIDVGTLTINVAQMGQVLTGGFRYTEVCQVATSISPAVTIYSTRLISVDVTGNVGRVKAIGYLNGTPAELYVEALDDNFCGDWYLIRATPIKSMLPYFYEAAGGVFRGDICVFCDQPVGRAYGEGTISVPCNIRSVPNIGRFAFKAEVSSSGVVRGSVHYVEYYPYSISIVSRPKVVIYVPEVVGLKFPRSNEAVLFGKGVFNGRPAEVQVRVIDNRPDFFFITARCPVDSTADWAGYSAGGPLTSGNVTVVGLPTDVP